MTRRLTRASHSPTVAPHPYSIWRCVLDRSHEVEPPWTQGMGQCSRPCWSPSTAPSVRSTRSRRPGPWLRQTAQITLLTVLVQVPASRLQGGGGMVGRAATHPTSRQRGTAGPSPATCTRTSGTPAAMLDARVLLGLSPWDREEGVGLYAIPIEVPGGLSATGAGGQGGEARVGGAVSEGARLPYHPREAHVAGASWACAPCPARDRALDPGAAGILCLKRLGGFALATHLEDPIPRLGPDGTRPPGVALLRAYALG
jgi:hypothetical protein